MSKSYYIPRRGGVLWGERFFQRYFRHAWPVPDFPRTIQIQTRSGCNALCRFCPNEHVSRALSHGSLEESLYCRIIDECVRHGVHRFSPFLMNEPLIDPDLAARIRYIADRKGADSVIKINSNGSLLTEENSRALIESGLDHLTFSVHGIDPATYAESMGNLRLEDTLRRIDRFLELRREMGAARPRIRIAVLKTKSVEPQIPAIRSYWGARNVEVRIHGVGNRADSRLTQKGLQAGKWQSYRWCTDLFDQAFILWTGDLAMCCADWRRTTILGNVHDQTIHEIWNGPRYGELRRKFLAGDVGDMLCGRCLREPED